MDTPLLDLIEARRARDEGTGRVVDNLQAAWRDEYRLLVEDFLDQYAPGRTFVGEDIRVYLTFVHGLLPPHHPNAWGAMARSTIGSWLKHGLIIRDGMAQAQSVASHAHHYMRYRVV